MNDTPLISIIMPVYNGTKYLPKAISSVLGQTYKNFEFIIVDDGSEENIEEIVNGFSDDRIKFFKREHAGISTQLNFGLEMAKGEFIARMDSDDSCLPERLDKQISFLFDHPEISVVGSNIIYIDENDEIIQNREYPEHNAAIAEAMPILASVCHPAIMLRADVFKSVGKYAEDAPPVEDLEIFLRMIEKGIQFYNIQECLLYYRFKRKYDYEKYDKQNIRSFEVGFKYLKKMQDSYPKDQYLKKLGLLHYYKGNVNSAFKLLVSSFLLNPFRNFYNLRFIFPSMLGSKVLLKLRHAGILTRVNRFFKTKMNIDLQKIR